MRVLSRIKFVNLIAVAAAVSAAILAGMFYVWSSWAATGASVSGPMGHEVYVWQRRWDGKLSNSIERAAGEVGGFSVLAAEVSLQGREVSVVRVGIDYEMLKRSDRPIGLCLRIGPYSGTFERDGEAAEFVGGLAGQLIADARAAGLELAELQIDYDCAESKLKGYRRLLEAVRARAGGVAVTITTLPCWLKHREFGRLARATDGFVLQVHSLERPAGVESPMTLCDVGAARRWVEQAGRVGVAFRVALPTYGYVVAFDKSGEFVGLCAEGALPAWDENVTLDVVQTDAGDMASLVQEWVKSRPGHMEGVIWYRLPVETDVLNWDWVTLSTIMDGRVPRRSLRTEVAYPEACLAEVVLVNDGEMGVSVPSGIELEYEAAKVMAGDGLQGFALGGGVWRNRLDYAERASMRQIRVGERWTVGWLRFSEETEVKAYVTGSNP